jgi:tRNA (adenine22-N1)-methyltransferase
MIKLSKRLNAIASFVRKDAKIADIGCDHALLDIYLVTNNPNITSIAVDVKDGALKQAKKNTSKYNIKDAIELRLGDGLDVVGANEIDTIVISGLGCPKIIEILSKNVNKLSNVTDLIIQSNTDYYHLRKVICKLGYYINNEVLVKENDIIYVIIHFKRGKKLYKESDYLFGPYLKKEKSLLYKELINDDLKKKEILYNLIPQKYGLKKLMIKREIFKLKKELI